ncbi:hypothetical protein BC834DRAFT_843742 [Gloeopeniophorella convolvens]|nr:hypothetical protein BC834DRAFT_843742 [Gloeopeniophorella convolvens]
MGSGALDYDIESQWSAGTSRSEDAAGMEVETAYSHHSLPPVAAGHYLDDASTQRRVGFGDSYSPASEEGMSPEPAADEDPASSPLGPMTPFGVFVDRAVAAAQFLVVPKSHFLLPQLTTITLHMECNMLLRRRPPHFLSTKRPHVSKRSSSSCARRCPYAIRYFFVQENRGSTRRMGGCIRLEGLHDWHEFAHAVYGRRRTAAFPSSSVVPGYLRPILLLSTLLQPSAVFLAIWYIVAFLSGLGASRYEPRL